MRGKHGKSAAHRHQIADLEARAAKAERELAKASVAYEQYRERTDREIRVQREQLRGLRDAAAETLVADFNDAVERANKLRLERDEALAAKALAQREVRVAQGELARLYYAVMDAVEDRPAAWAILIRAGLARRSPSGKGVIWTAKGIRVPRPFETQDPRGHIQDFRASIGEAPRPEA